MCSLNKECSLNTFYLLDEENTYDMGFVMKQIPNVLNRDLLDIEKFFQNYNLISFDEVCSYIESHIDQMEETKFEKVDPKKLLRKDKMIITILKIALKF